MLPWFTLVVSVIGNIINIINNRGNFKALNNALHDLRKRNADKKAGIDFIRRIDPYGTINMAAFTRSLMLYFFLLSITSSSVLGLSSDPTSYGIPLASYAVLIYFYSSLIPNVIFLFRVKDLGCLNYVILAGFTMSLGVCWGKLTAWILSFGIPLFYAGCIAGIIIGIISAILTIKSWTVDWWV